MTQISTFFSYPGARVALLGFGGIGKSQLAIEYTHRVRDAFPQKWVFWVHASNQARMQEGFEQIAEILDLPGREDPKENIFQIVGQWLKDTGDKWLLVLDNADDPIMFSRLAREERAKEESGKENPGLLTFPPLVTPHLPHTQNGSILVTSRNEEASLALVGEDQNIIHVGEMNEKESLDLLLKKLNKTVDPQGASDLVKALDYVPLAITQAAAFLSRRKGRVSISQYVKDFNKSNEKIIHLLKPEFVNPRRDHSAVNSTIATWQISFDHIRVNWPSASEILSLMSFFNYQGVPEFLLRDSQDPVLSGFINEDLNDGFEEGVQILRDYCLISLGEDTSTFRMHRLVQASTQDWLKSHGSHEKSWRMYIRILSKAYEMASDDWERFRQLLPHVEFVGSQEPPDEYLAEDWAGILLRVSHCKNLLGEYEKAEQISRNALEIVKRLFGEGHPVTLTSLNSLGWILVKQGKNEEAGEKIREAVDGRKGLLGESHHDTLESMKDMAFVLRRQGKNKAAEAMLRLVLERAQEQYSGDWNFMQECRTILAGALQNQRRYDEAEQIMRQILAERQKAVPEYDLDTVTVWANLAGVLKAQKKFQEAEEIYRWTLKRREITLGPNSPLTINVRVKLALLLHDAEKYEEAEVIGRQCLEGRERMVWKEDGDTARWLHRLELALGPRKLHRG